MKYSYEYDNAGNIKTVRENNVITAKYYYNAQNQLYIEENFALNKTYEYTYDTFGNI